LARRVKLAREVQPGHKANKVFRDILAHWDRRACGASKVIRDPKATKDTPAHKGNLVLPA